MSLRTGVTGCGEQRKSSKARETREKGDTGEMSRKATARKLAPVMTIADRMLAQQRALEAGKAGYKRADELTDELIVELRAGRIRLNEPIPLGNGTVGILIDKFEEKDRIGAGLSVRRFDVVIERASDIASKL